MAIRRSSASGCSIAIRSKQRSSMSLARVSIWASAAMTDSARVRSASRRAWVARFMAEPTSLVIWTSSPLTMSSWSWKAETIVPSSRVVVTGSL